MTETQTAETAVALLAQLKMVTIVSIQPPNSSNLLAMMLMTALTFAETENSWIKFCTNAMMVIITTMTDVMNAKLRKVSIVLTTITLLPVTASRYAEIVTIWDIMHAMMVTLKTLMGALTVQLTTVTIASILIPSFSLMDMM